jgi:hypothetical protein
MEAKMPISVTPETDKPLPDDFEPEAPTTFKKKVEVASKTAKVLMDGGAEIPTSTQEKIDAEHLFKAFTDLEENPKLNKITTKTLETPATVQHLYKMLNDYDQQVVEEAVQLRRFITNKLIEDTGHTDARHRLKALELLGKISDVGLFSEKTEVVVKHSTPEDLENQIKNKLAKLITKGKTIEASSDDIEGEMGSVDEDEE